VTLALQAGDGPVDGEPLCEEAVAPTGWWQTSFVNLLLDALLEHLADTFRPQNHAAQASGTVADILGSTAGHGAMITHPFAGFAALASLTIHLHLFVFLLPPVELADAYLVYFVSKYWPQSSDTPVNNAFHIEQTTSILTALRDVCELGLGRPFKNIR
jgi:hypothetical protein